jgi:hypothetical protein
MEPFGPVMQPSITFRISRRQMVDKIWYDWQNRDPKNAKSYFGGSVQYLDSLASYNQYPNGAPPFLNVRF